MSTQSSDTKRRRKVDGSFWKGRSVFITGHTGFKGSWLSYILTSLGAKVTGYSLNPPTTPSLFEEAGLAEILHSSVIGDIRDRDSLTSAVRSAKASVCFHLAAQPIVLSSYQDPVYTFDVNVTGTAAFLDAVRACPEVRSTIVITSDKCYENKEWCWSYRESDTLGGYDPYSNSKACAELVCDSFRNSFFHPSKHQEHKVVLASTRAGNVIGGGDWAPYRLVPDIIRALTSNSTLQIRNPGAVRPWQHVLEPIVGYITLAQAMSDDIRYGTPFNFGPREDAVRTVGELAREFQKHISLTIELEESTQKAHEANFLTLDCSKAATVLPWSPVLSFEQTIEMTATWYSRWKNGTSARELLSTQAKIYLDAFNA